MLSVLVTGATGFIGSQLVQRLVARGERVRCLVRRQSQTTHLRSLNVDLVVGDLDEASNLAECVRGCHTLFHLAGRTSALKTRDLYRTNAWGSYELARACAKQATPPRLIVVSSLAAAGTEVAGRPRNHRDPIRPISEYGRSKRAGELAVAAWSDRVPISIIRPGIVFGPGNREMLPVFRSIARFRVHAVPGFTPRRVALIHNDDLLDLLLRVADSGSTIAGPNRQEDAFVDRSQGYYFAAAPEFPTYGDLGRMIAAALGTHRWLLVPVAEPIAYLAAAGNEWINRYRGRSDSFNLDKMREAFAGHWTTSVDQARDELGFVPQLPLQTRLEQTAAWYQQQGWL